MMNTFDTRFVDASDDTLFTLDVYLDKLTVFADSDSRFARVCVYQYFL